MGISTQLPSTSTRHINISMASFAFAVLSAVLCIVVEAQYHGHHGHHGIAHGVSHHAHGIAHGVDLVQEHGVGYAQEYTPGHASGVTHYDTYGTGPSSGHTNLHTYSRNYATPVYKTVHYQGPHGHHGHHGHGYRHGYGYGGSYTVPAGYEHHHEGAFAYDPHVQPPANYPSRHSTSYDH